MAKGPIKAGRRPPPRLQTRTAESENPNLAKQIATQARRETLDMSRPYGVVTGNLVVEDAAGKQRNVAFEQKSPIKGQPSRLYDPQKVRILRPGEKSALPPQNTLKEKADAAEPQTEPAPAPELDEDEEEDPPIDMGELAASAEGGDGEVNLTAWAEGVVKYRWAQVRDAIEERYHRAVNDPDEARDFLAENGIGRVSKRNANPEYKAEE